MDKVKVVIINDQKTVKIPTGIRILLRRCCNAVVQLEKLNGEYEVNITFVDNKKIRELNKKYRNIDKPTDVLSFPMGENGKYPTNPETGYKI
ncbi:MAG: rRNA maturation RNase YbeY, partial [Clostridia bacterium]|nr:rRNA maturation RNase YbeY [Clostridia bacterium]